MNKLFHKFFVVKEIFSRSGDLHFRRYRLLSTPWFSIYIHQICRSDEDIHAHDHPFNFTSVILKGSYEEKAYYPPNFDKVFYTTYHPGDVVTHAGIDAHKLTLTNRSQPVWTLVVTSGRNRKWGYRLNDGSWVSQEEYRILKNEGKL